MLKNALGWVGGHVKMLKNISAILQAGGLSLENVVKTTNFKYLRQLEEKEGFIENKIMGIKNNKN